MQTFDVTVAVGRLSPSQQAALKKHVGKRLSEADGAALQAFYTVLPWDTPQYQQERLFAVMCMMCLWKEEERKAPKPLPECLRLIGETESAKSRFRSILDARWDEDGFMLAKLTRLVRWVRGAQQAFYPDFERLKNDLMYWNSDDRFVQRRWAKEYFGVSDKNEKNDKEEE